MSNFIPYLFLPQQNELGFGRIRLFMLVLKISRDGEDLILFSKVFQRLIQKGKNELSYLRVFEKGALGIKERNERGASFRNMLKEISWRKTINNFVI